MEPGRSKITLRIAAIAGLMLLIAAGFIFASRYRSVPASLVGAIVQKSDDPNKQTPVTGAEVSLAGPGPSATATSNIAGYFKLTLPPGIRQGQPVTLVFRQNRYEPLELRTTVQNKLYVVQLTPLRTEGEPPPPTHPDVSVRNILVRYSIETRAEVNVGTAVKTFQVVNTGDVPCNGHPPCSPDNHWKAAVGGASLDAGQGNVFQNARVSCIAGPCPFTRIETDEFSQGGRVISVSVRGWSDTTTFLFEAEVFRLQVSDLVRESYPVIFGQTLNFSLPAAAEGPSLEAEVGGVQITFPLGPTANPILSWAVCNVTTARNRSKSYRCELSPGYKF